MNATYFNIIVEQEYSTRVITINREEKLNALNKDTLAELHIAISTALDDSKIKGIIITGAGNRAFVAGADISELANLKVNEAYDLAKKGQNLVFNMIHQADKPIVAAINGFALGGGLELAMACHIRIATEHAKMGLPEVSLGLIPGYGGTQRLTEIVGRGRALEIILSADPVSAEKALSIGLVNYVVSQSDLLSKAKHLLNTIYTRSQNAVSAAIRAVNAFPDSKGYELEIDEFSKLFGTDEFKEGVNAFLEKRKPNF